MGCTLLMVFRQVFRSDHMNPSESLDSGFLFLCGWYEWNKRYTLSVGKQNNTILTHPFLNIVFRYLGTSENSTFPRPREETGVQP